MNIESLSISFSKIGKKFLLAEYLQKICFDIVSKPITRKDVDEILVSYNVNSSLAKVDFINLIFEYVRDALEDNVLTATEKENIKFLKLLFRIQEGDFYLHNEVDVKASIALQMTRIYQDSFISDEEALLKVDLQEIFDLSFDQMNEYSKGLANVLIKEGADPLRLDVFFTQKEYFKLR